MILELTLVARFIAFIAGVLNLYDVFYYFTTRKIDHTPSHGFVLYARIIGTIALSIAVIIGGLGFNITQSILAYKLYEPVIALCVWICLAVAAWTHVYKYAVSPKTTTAVLLIATFTGFLAVSL